MKATLQTIADELGVSRSTVSNADSRPDQLSPELRARILGGAAAGLLGPQPDGTLAAQRQGQRDRRAADRQPVDGVHRPYAVAYLRGLAEAASARETSLLLLNLPKDEAAGRRVISNAAVDAFCLTACPTGTRRWSSSAPAACRSCGEDPQAFGPDASYVGIDERAAAGGSASTSSTSATATSRWWRTGSSTTA